ncbi:hypothetical protein EON65_36235 [archaeon]|nr:MAG: hypothetical protein EON65_36235 [archaeon]
MGLLEELGTAPAIMLLEVALYDAGRTLFFSPSCGTAMWVRKEANGMTESLSSVRSTTSLAFELI